MFFSVYDVNDLTQCALAGTCVGGFFATGIPGLPGSLAGGQQRAQGFQGYP